MSEASEGGSGRSVASAPGSDSVAPQQIPASGWRLIVRRVGRRVMTDQLPLLSAGIAFFAVLSIAPVLVTALSVYGAVNTPAEALEQLSAVAGTLPEQLRTVVADQLISITAASTQVLTVRGLTALIIALWTATAAMTYLIEALSLAYCEDENRPMLRRTGLAVVFVLGGAVLVAAVLTVTGLVAKASAGAPEMIRPMIQALVWVGLALLMALALTVLYRFAPDRQRPAQWRWVNWGAVVATGLWVATSVGLFAYVRSLGTYERTYGSLAGVAISMFWLWITVLLVLLGAVINAEAERQTARDTTAGAERPMGERGAVVADSAPPYPGEESTLG